MGSTPTGMKNADGIGKIAIFELSRSLPLIRLTGENLSIRNVVRGHNGALAEEYAVSSTTLVVVEVC